MTEPTPDIKNIGSLSLPLLVFGGPYSNWEALATLRCKANKAGIPPEQVICTGDIVGYCAYPEACIQLIREWGIHCIAGNVEIQLRNEADDCGCNFNKDSTCDQLSQQWYTYAKNKVSALSKKWLHTLPRFIKFELKGKKGWVLHGGYPEVSDFIFPSTSWQKKQSLFEKTGADLILAGHCGLPFHQHNNKQYWINAGVIGMPANDGQPQVWYVTLESCSSRRFTYTFHPLSYDYEAAARNMEQVELPAAYASTLRTGIWPSCDILPPKETQKQAKPIQLEVSPVMAQSNA